MLRAGDQIGSYTLVNKLGSGAFGSVWLAEKRTAVTTTQAALKIPLSDDMDFNALRQEANVWVQASGHPNVLPIIEADIYDGIVVIASEYAPSGSLEDWLKRNGGAAPSIASAVEMTSGILAGLEHLHSRRIIHRDIKPANILLQGQTPRLADFGISRLLQSDQQTFTVSGTLPYMSPEAINGERNERTDVWSVSVVFYQLLTGRLPYPQKDMGPLLSAIQHSSPDPIPSSIPEQIQNVITRAFDRNSQNRFESAAEMRTALRSMLEEINSIGFSDIRPLPDNDLGNGIKLGGIYRDTLLKLVAGNWIKYYGTGWVRSGWLFMPGRTHNFAETFFKIHIFHDGHGYIHVLASANPAHTIWLETATGFRMEKYFCWDGIPSIPRTDLWEFTWKQ
jgi:serine/threonine protein kinase